ncbi:MAG: hypothetical protein K2Y23_01090 [Cyanobacteria bacterium]|nr:hypothetical protein [Cyanobacteriota bacterium]
MATLTGRVGQLEAGNRDLRRQIARLLTRKPVEVTAMALPRPPFHSRRWRSIRSSKPPRS